jgi:hypothetical protein
MNTEKHFQEVEHEVHPVLHLLIILACFSVIFLVNLSVLPELLATFIYEAIILGFIFAIVHWIYRVKH